MKYAFLFSTLTAAIFIGCSADPTPSNEQQPAHSHHEGVEQEHTSAEVREYFETLTEVVDAYIDMIEEMAAASEKKGSDDFGGALDMLGSAATGLAKMAPLLERMEELEKDAEVLKDDMSPEELQIFLEEYAKIMARFAEASAKMNQY